MSRYCTAVFCFVYGLVTIYVLIGHQMWLEGHYNPLMVEINVSYAEFECITTLTADFISQPEDKYDDKYAIENSNFRNFQMLVKVEDIAAFVFNVYDDYGRSFKNILLCIGFYYFIKDKLLPKKNPTFKHHSKGMSEEKTDDNEEKEELKQIGQSFDEYHLEAEIHKPYVKAARSMFTDITDIEIMDALKYLKRRNCNYVNATILCNATGKLRSGEVEMFYGTKPKTYTVKKELVRILQPTFEDAADVVVRYKRQHGYLPTKEEFVEFYESLRGIADLERKCVRKDIQNGKLLEEKKEKVKEKDNVVEERNKVMKERDEAIRELEEIKKRVTCKICYANEISLVLLPCRHTFSCGIDQCRNSLNIGKTCHLCKEAISGQLMIRLS